jgi:hypothetical protein
VKVTANTPKLVLTPEVDQRIRHWIDMAAGEVSGLGLADQLAEAFVVSEVFLLKQCCGAAETELDQAAVAALLTELDASGIDIARVRFWWHSHASFATFWSRTDDATVDRLAIGDWLACLVMNKAGARLARLDVTRPVRATLDDLPVEIAVEDLGLRGECERQFRERVTEVAATALTCVGPIDGERKLLGEGRLDRARPHGLDWDDFDDLLGPETGGGGFDVER